MKKSYSEKLKDPRWQKKRLEIMQRDKFECRWCCDGTNTLNVHHLKYSGEPWETPNEFLITICEECHKNDHAFREEAESDLLTVLKHKGFSHEDLRMLVWAFDNAVTEDCYEIAKVIDGILTHEQALLGAIKILQNS